MENKTHTGFRVRQEGYRQIVQLRTSWIARIFATLFMTVWLTGWSIGCVAMIHGLATNFSWFFLLFSIPFFVGWITGVSIWMASLFGKEQLILEKDHLEYEFSVLVPVKRRRIPYQEILSIEMTTINRSSAIKIESTSQPLIFGSSHRLHVLEELCEYLLGEVPMPAFAHSL